MAGLPAVQAAAGDVPPRNRIDARLLLSIDRREGAAAAMDTARLAVEQRARGVVGLDLSGESSGRAESMETSSETTCTLCVP